MPAQIGNQAFLTVRFELVIRSEVSNGSILNTVR